MLNICIFYSGCLKAIHYIRKRPNRAYLFTLSTNPPVRTCSAALLCDAIAYSLFISQAACLTFISPYEEKWEIEHIIPFRRKWLCNNGKFFRLYKKRDLEYIFSSPIPNPVINISLMPFTTMLCRRKELRTNLTKEMKLNLRRMSLNVRKCVPEKVFRRLKRQKWLDDYFW